MHQHVKKLYFLGLSLSKRLTLAKANEQRPAIIFEKLYQYSLILDKLRQTIDQQGAKAVIGNQG